MCSFINNYYTARDEDDVWVMVHSERLQAVGSILVVVVIPLRKSDFYGKQFFFK